MNKRIYLAVGLGLSLSCGIANATNHSTVWVTPIQGGELRFDDWGYTGPGGRTARDFAPINGFGGLKEGNLLDPAGGVGQIQRVVTTNPDKITPDASYSVIEDLGGPNLYLDANMDAQVNFYKWGYTTVAGSTFSNMRIDYDGDYYINRNDMSFNYYRTFDYTNMDPTGPLAAYTPPDGEYQTNIQFKPYALSDAVGWCGSVMASNPEALEAMAGQVTFDFAFEAFFGRSDIPGEGTPGTGGLQIIPDFEMRSYGTLTVDVALNDGTTMTFTSDAVVNNTDPSAGAVNPVTGNKEVGGTGVNEAYRDTVSFMGGGVVPSSVFLRVADTSTYNSDIYKVYFQENILEVLDSSNIVAIYDDVTGAFVEARDAVTGEVLPNVVLHTNSFSGYPFLMRADGMRIVEGFDFSVYNDYSAIPASGFNSNGELINVAGEVIQDLSAVPVPAAVWLFGSGLIGLAGLVRRKKTA